MADSDEERLVGSDRVLAVLIELAKHPAGITLDELAQALASSKPTVHRALASLRRAGLADQLGRGVYLLGDEFLRLAFVNHAARPEITRIEPMLKEIATTFRETAHYAVLDGWDVVYRAKVDPPEGAVRLTSTVGGRNPAYRTAVGQLLLSMSIASEDELSAWVGDRQLEAKTQNSITSVSALYERLRLTRERGYGADDQETDVGVNCVALPLYLDGAAAPAGAVSVSALAFRYPIERLVESIPALRGIIEAHLGAGAAGPSR